ncbi:MAG: integrase [Flavobacteriia bacterium]|nr:MAG: integrase [Flavobacteriia bacterium]
MEIVYLVLVGFIAGIINTLAGGGSVLTLPMLIFMGLPPAMANGTNRIGVFVNTIFGVFGFKSKGVAIVKQGFYWGLAATLGSVIGALWAVDIKGETFNTILGFVILFVVFITVFKPKVSTLIAERLHGKYFWWSMLAFFFIGIFGGFIQAGTGFFILLVLTQINQLNLVKSNALKLLIVAVYTVAALAIFIYHGQVNWYYGLILATGQAAGAWLASRWSVKKDDVWIRGFLVVVAIAMAVKLWFF